MSIYRDMKFNLHDGTHFFFRSNKEDSLKMLNDLLKKAERSVIAWEEDDSYLSHEDNKKVRKQKKHFVKVIQKWIKRIEAQPHNSWWSLDVVNDDGYVQLFKHRY